MKKSADIFKKMREFFYSEAFKVACQKCSKDFSRCRILNHQVIFLFILNLLKRSILIEFINFSLFLGLRHIVTGAAISKARAKLSPSAFIVLNDVLVKEFYHENKVKTFYGFVPLVIDGSTLELPINSPAIEKKYGYATNHTKTKVPMAKVSYLYDPENGICVDAILSPYGTEERKLAFKHLEKIPSLLSKEVKEKLLLIMDRGYPSADLIFYLLKHNINFVIRGHLNFIKEINEVILKGQKDTLIEISIRKKGPVYEAFKKYFPGIEGIKLRVILITLENGKTEILLTSLINKPKYPYNIFSALYFKRWGVEENYKFHKSTAEIENFSGKSCHAVEQDFHAVILSANARACLALEASEEVNVYQRELNYQINKVVSMAILKQAFISIIIDREANLEDFCTQYINIIKRQLVPIRPQRKYKRQIKHGRRKYCMNKRH